MKGIAILLLAAALAGCGGGLRSQIVGKWKVDLSSIKGTGLTETTKQTPEYDNFVKQFGKSLYDFGDDGRLLISDSTVRGSGALISVWKLNGHEITIKPIDYQDGPDSDEHFQVNDDGTHMVLLVGKESTSFSADLEKQK